MLRALIHALTAQTAFVEIYISHVVSERDGIELTGLDALSATYAGHVTSILGNRTLILVYATHVNAAVHLVTVPNLDYATRAGLDAVAA